MPRRLPSSEAAQLTVLQMQRAQEIMFESLAKNGKRLCISELDLHFEGMLALHLKPGKHPGVLPFVPFVLTYCLYTLAVTYIQGNCKRIR